MNCCRTIKIHIITNHWIYPLSSVYNDMKSNSNSTNGSDKRFINHIFNCYSNKDITSKTPDGYEWVKLDDGVGIESKQKDPMNGFVEIVINGNEANLEKIIEEKDINPNKYGNSYEILNKYNPDLVVRELKSTYDHTKTLEVEDCGIGMNRDDMLNKMATIHGNSTHKKNNDLIQGGHGKGRLSALNYAENFVIFSSPTENPDQINGTIMRINDNELEILVNQNKKIPSYTSESGLTRDDTEYLKDSGTIVRMINYDFGDKNKCPSSITGCRFQRKLGSNIGRISPLKLIDTESEDHTKFIGSKQMIKQNKSAFECIEIEKLRKNNIEILDHDAEVMMAIQKRADVRDELYESGDLTREFAGDKSKHKGNNIKTLISKNGAGIRYMCNNTIHHKENRSRFKDMHKNISDDIIVMVDVTNQDHLFDAQRQSMLNNKLIQELKDNVDSKIENNDVLKRVNDKRGKLEHEERGTDSDTKNSNSQEYQKLSYFEIKEYAESSSEKIELCEKSIVYWFNQSESKREEAIDHNNLAKQAKKLHSDYRKYKHAVHLGNDLSDSIGDIGLCEDKDSGPDKYIELKISENNSSGTRFNTSPDLLQLSRIYNTIPPMCSDIKSNYDNPIESKLGNFSYPQNIENKREEQGRYIRDEILDDKSVSKILNNKDQYKQSTIDAAITKSDVEELGGKVIHKSIYELTSGLYTVDNKRLKFLTVLLTAGIHKIDHIKLCIKRHNCGESIEKILEDYEVIKIHIREDGEFETTKENTMNLVDIITDLNKIVLKGPIYKNNGNLAKRVEIGHKNQNGDYECMYKLQFNWRNVFQGIKSFSIEGFEGEFFDNLERKYNM